MSTKSANQERRRTAKFENNLITEEDSDFDSDCSDPKQAKDKRRSQEINDPNLLAILNENNDDSVTKQIKKVNNKPVSEQKSATIKTDKRKGSPSSDVDSPERER